MSNITVYGIPGSPFLRSVEIALKEKHLPYQLSVMSPADMKTSEHLERHPFGRIPMFEQDGFRLYESQAIIRYVDDVFPDPPLVPPDPRARARMNQVIGIIEWYLFPKAAAPIGFQRIIGPKLLGLPSDEKIVADAMPMARTCIAELERLLGDAAYFGGDKISIADIMLGAQLDLLSECDEGRDLISGTPLQTWLDRMRSRQSFAETRPPAALRQAA
jgi:glutathione S-transferase